MSSLRSLIVSGSALLLVVVGLAACAPNPTTAPPAPAPSLAPTPAAMSGTAIVKLARVTGFGLFLTDGANRTLYAFANDTKDTSNCSGTCVQNWPPFTTQGAPEADTGITASLLGTITRADGSMQVTYDGHPLYYFSGDKNPGDIKGQGIGNVWHVLSPRGNPMNNSLVPSATATP